MDFLILSRAADVTVDDPALDERHWRYMDGFAAAFTARGPTLAADRETWTGSLHVVALDSVEAARGFVDAEPYQQAGQYRDHLVLRFADRLGRTMWEFEGLVEEPRFLVVARYAGDPGPQRQPRAVAELPDELRAGLVVHGALRSLDEHPWGVVMAVQQPTRAALDALLADERTGLVGHEVEVHDWEFGGRR